MQPLQFWIGIILLVISFVYMGVKFAQFRVGLRVLQAANLTKEFEKAFRAPFFGFLGRAGDPLEAQVRNYYYLDSEAVSGLYDQIQQDPVVTKSSAETLSKSGISGRAGGDAVTLSAEKGGEVRRIEEFSHELTPIQKYRVVENHLKGSEPMSVAVNEFKPDHERESAFRKSARQFEADCEVKLPDGYVDEWCRKKLLLGVPFARVVMKAISGFVVVRGTVLVSAAQGDVITLTCGHEINMYTAEESEKAYFGISCLKGNLTAGSAEAFVEGVSLPITCVGRAVRWDENSGTLFVRPLAVF